MKLSWKRNLIAAAVVSASLGLAGCNSNPTVATASSSVSTGEVLVAHAKMAHANYADTLAGAKALQRAVDSFIANPTAETQMAAKRAWLASRESYGQTEVFRFRGGPIDDDASTAEPDDGPEGQINAWPLAEGLIDYVVSNKKYQMMGNDMIDTHVQQYNLDQTNLIADKSFQISKQSLAEANEMGDDEANVTTGYHAIEFLLWGQDLNIKDAMKRDTSGGLRSHTDYIVGSGCTNGNCDRRARFLKAATDLLVDDIAAITVEWDPQSGAHYQKFVNSGAEGLNKILTGMGQLSYGELASERIKIALMSDSQEDEHSCFSDNTHRDIVTNAQGVENSYHASYNGKKFGPGIHELLASVNGDLAARLNSSLATTMNAAHAVDRKAQTGMPFDNQIQGSADDKAAVQQVVVGLVEQTNVIAEAIEVLGHKAEVKDEEVTYASDKALLGNKEAE